MLRITSLLAAAVLVLGVSTTCAQTTSQAPPSAGTQATTPETPGVQSGSLAPGTALNAELTRTVDSKKVKPGDAVTAQMTEPIKVDGKTVIPKNTKLVGHVTRSTARAKGDSDSVLGMQFDRAVLKDGQEMPLQVKLQALASEQGAQPVSGDDLQPVGNIEGGAAGAGAAGNRGNVGGVGSTVGGASSGAASTVPRTIDQTGATNQSTVAASNPPGSPEGGLTPSGQLKTTSRGVYGLNGLSLNPNSANPTDGSVIISAGKNVHLDGGTRLLLVAQANTSEAQR